MSRKKQGGGKRRKALDHDEPFRTCVACRASRPRDEMLRFARAPDGALGFDVRARLPGRGAWTCARPECVRRAVEKGGFERAFEAPVLARPAPLADAVAAALGGEVSAGLGLLRRAGRLAAGRDDVARALEAGTVTAFVLSSDLSERTRRDVEARAGGLPVVTGPAQAEVGRAVGRKPTGVLGLLGGPRAELVLADLRRLSLFARPAASDTVARMEPSPSAEGEEAGEGGSTHGADKPVQSPLR